MCVCVCEHVYTIKWVSVGVCARVSICNSYHSSCIQLASFPDLLTPAFVASSTSSAATNAGVRRPGNGASIQ